MTEAYLGQIKLFSFGFPPRGWALCQGQTLPINNFAALFSLLGTTYGGNGTNNFQLPDLRGRSPMNWGQGPGLTNRVVGESAGTENVTLTASQLPTHNHQFFGSTAPATRRPVVGGTFADDQVADVDYLAPNNASPSNYVTLAPQSLANTGGGQPHSNLQPYLTLNWAIATSGIYPSRN